jgi:hypothetical protein
MRNRLMLIGLQSAKKFQLPKKLPSSMLRVISACEASPSHLRMRGISECRNHHATFSESGDMQGRQSLTQMDTTHQVEARDDQLGESEINELLRRKRKTRGQRACYPCRQRKVKCDYGSPCHRCIEREHPDLCQYQPTSKRQDVEPPSPQVPPVVDSDRLNVVEWNQLWSKLEKVETLLRELKSELGNRTGGATYVTVDDRTQAGISISGESKAREANPSASGIQASTGLEGESVHLGYNSVPAMAIALGRGSNEQAIQDIVGNSILPLFGLDNESATYPFVDLWGLPPGSATRVEELCKLIPTDADCRQFLRQYRDTAHIIYPGVVDIDQLELDLTQFLIERSSQRVYPHSYIVESSNVYGKTLHWVGLLFACLASGCQCSELPRKERQLTSQVYGKRGETRVLLSLALYTCRLMNRQCVVHMSAFELSTTCHIRRQ